MAYQSGEFLINQQLNNYNEFQSAATVFNNNLVVMTSWGQNNDIDLVQTVFPLNDLIAQSPADPTEPISDQGLKTASNWTSTQILKGAQSAKPALAALPVSNPDTLFTFYTLKPAAIDAFVIELFGIKGIRFPLNDSVQSRNNQWSAPILLLDSDGANMPVPSRTCRDVCTTVIGDNIVLVTCASAAPFAKARAVVLKIPQTGDVGIGTFVGVYDKRKINFDTNEWKAEYSTYVPYFEDFKNSDTNRVLMEWYPSVSSDGKLGHRLLLITINDRMDQFNYSRRMGAFQAPMTVSDNGTVTLGSFDGAIMENAGQPPTPYYLATLQRDPTGRLRCWCSVGNNKNMTAYNLEISGNQVYFGATTNTIVASEESGNSVSPSAALLYIATEAQYVGKIPATKPGFPDLKTNNFPVYEFVFYGEYPKCQVRRLATIQTVADAEDNPRVVDLQQSESNPAPVYVIGGIINGPIPFPLENYKYYNPGNSEASAGTLTYGTNDKTILGRKVAKSWSIGYEEEVKTTEGIGPDFKLAFHAGMGSVEENTTEYGFIKNLTQEANIIYDGDLKEPRSDSEGVIKKMSVNIQITAYNYLDNYGPSVISTDQNTSKSGMSAASIQISYDDSGDFLTFPQYDVTPGDLTSYMPDAINKRMVEQFGYKGSKYGYTDDNYFGDVICQNALPMGDRDYLEMSWDASGKFTQGFSQMQTSYKENSWNYDGSLYAGISGGAGFELFGLGEKMEFSAMAGADLSREYSTSEEKETEWGIDISEPWGPPSPGVDAGPKSVKHFVFRIYFLPVPTQPSILPANHWTQELFDFLPADNALTPQIDKNSACWKIYYVVTDIIYQDGTELSYQRNSLDRPSVYGGSATRAAVKNAQPANSGKPGFIGLFQGFFGKRIKRLFRLF